MKNRILLPILLLVFSCEEPAIDGCTTTTACNYNADANKDDGSCLENDCADVCGGSNICGCNDTTALNYDSTTTFNDGSCEFDTTAPTVVIKYPANNSTLDSTITVRVDVTDDSDIASVMFFIDGSKAYTDTLSPYEYEWDVCVQSTGSHTLRVKATDSAGNLGQSDISTFTINASYDCESVCGGDELSCADCGDAINGDAVVDMCGTCDADPSNDCVQDCAGVWGGDSQIDECLVGSWIVDLESILINDETYVYEFYHAHTWTFNSDGSVVIDTYKCESEYSGCDNWSLSEGEIDTETYSWIITDNQELQINFVPFVSSTTFNSPTELVMVLNIDSDNFQTLTMHKCSLGIDCLGECGGGAELDDCGICDTDSSNDNTPLTGTCDCVGILNGYATTDNCGTCDDDTTNDCVQDDCGVWGGNNSPNTGTCDCTGIPNGFAVDFGCGICIDYNSISFSKVNDNTSTSLLPTVCNYKNNFSDTYNTPAPDKESSYIFFDSENDTNSIIISAPHAQRAYRYSESDNKHDRDLYTGAYAQILSDLTGMPTIIAKYKTDDPNYYDYIPSETVLYENYIGEMIPYKKKLKEFIEDDSNNIMMVIDLHGARNDHFERTWAIDIGTGDGQSLNSEIGGCVPSIVTYIFEQYDIEISYDEVFAGWTNETVTRFIAQDINKDLDAMQFEMKRDYRGGCSSDTEYYPDNYFNMIMAYTELIFTMNYIYNSEIVTQ